MLHVKKPFPFVLTRDGCRKEYYTPEEAIADGLLPTDWMNCKNKISYKSSLAINIKPLFMIRYT